MNGWQNGKSKKMEVRNFSIIVLAQRLVKKRVREGSLYTLGGKERHLDHFQVSRVELESKSQEGGAQVRV
jgi:hypothetical protein